MGEALRSFRDLQVYKRAMEESSRLYDVSERFPREERYALTTQIRRCPSGVIALIAEAWARHHYASAFRNTISIAMGEVCETQAWLDHAERHGYITLEEFEEMNTAWQEIWAMLYRSLNHRCDVSEPKI